MSARARGRPGHQPSPAQTPGTFSSLLVVAALLLGCSGSPLPRSRTEPIASHAPGHTYVPQRGDYASFEQAQPDLLEPNYLPFMLHRFPRNPVAGDALVFCRWDESQMPLRIYVEVPRLGDDIQDEFSPIPPSAYVEAIDQALAVWQQALEGRVSFERVDRQSDAGLTIRLVGERATEIGDGRTRLGYVEALVDACRSAGWDPDAERMQVRFELPELAMHLADESGLLPPIIVRRLAIHELGHALGMKGHSPSPGDVMYPVLRDRVGRDELSLQDINSFLSLYALPNGTHLVDIPPEGQGEPASPEPPTGPPRLAMAPYVDAARGFEIGVPVGWTRIGETHGVLLANGPSWDYDASLRLFVWPAPNIEHFMACCAGELLAGSWMRGETWTTLHGRRTLRRGIEDASGEYAEELLWIELDGRRVMLVVFECPVEHRDAWAPWLEALLATLEIWEQG